MVYRKQVEVAMVVGVVVLDVEEVGTVRLHPRGKVWRAIASAFITSFTVGCTLYCSGTGRPIHLHWLPYRRRLYGSGKEYQREMSG